MEYISIGFGCNVKYQINQHVQQKETDFFDWLKTSMCTVNEIIKADDISKEFSVDNFRHNEKSPTHSGKAWLINNTYNQLESIHDVNAEYNISDLHVFVDKYIRRHSRLQEKIKNKGSIIFIRYDEDGKRMTSNEKKTFSEIISQKNPSLKYLLVEIIELDTDKIKVLHNENYIFINAKIFRSGLTDEQCKGDWTTKLKYNWKQIFQTIHFI